MPTGTLRLKVVRSDGSIKHDHSQPIDSFVIDYWRTYVFGIHTGSGGRLAWDAGGGTNAYNSIIVGSGSNVPTYADTALQTQILHGITAGRLVADPPVMNYNLSTGELVFSRDFLNNSGGTVNASECGIRVNSGSSTSSTGGLLIVRDTFSQIAVADTDTLVVEYTLKLPYGANNYARLFMRHLIGRDNDTMGLINQSSSTVEGTFGSGDGALNFVTATMTNNRGIVLGTGSTAASFADVTMDAGIGHGTGAGQLVYGECTNNAVISNTTASNFSVWYLTRYFENRSGGNITVNEIGLVSNATINSTNQVYLFDRRVLASPVTVPDNTIVTAIWKFRYDF
jgi:hypothetical protein